MSRNGNKVSVTKDAANLIRSLRAVHGDLMFHQSGGCCDGSAPMCYPVGEFKIGNSDILLGNIEGCDFYISASQYQYWKHTHLTVDLVKGRGSGFSLESPTGCRFIIRSKLL